MGLILISTFSNKLSMSKPAFSQNWNLQIIKTFLLVREVLNLICPECPSLSFRLLSDLKGHLESQHGMKDMSDGQLDISNGQMDMSDGQMDNEDGQSDEEEDQMEEEQGLDLDGLKAKVVSLIFVYFFVYTFFFTLFLFTLFLFTLFCLLYIF